jgi:hypothetical protein
MHLLYVVLSLVALAEEPSTIDIAWTTSYRARQDDLMSPLVHAGVAPFGGLFTYRHRGPRTSLLAGLEVDSVPEKSGPTYEYPTDDGTATTYPSSWTTARIPVGYGASVLHSDDVDLAVGGMFDARIEVLSWSYGVTYTTGYSGAFTLGPWVDGHWRAADRWTLEGSLTLPLFGWLARSPYALNDDEYILANQTHNPLVAFGAYFADGGLTWVGEHQAVRTRAAAVFELKGRTSLVAAWRFEVLHFTEPLPALAYGNALDLGVRVAL